MNNVVVFRTRGKAEVDPKFVYKLLVTCMQERRVDVYVLCSSCYQYSVQEKVKYISYKTGQIAHLIKLVLHIYIQCPRNIQTLIS